MVVDDFLNIGGFHPVYRLALFIMIDQNQLFPLRTEEISSGNHACIIPIFIQNGKIAITHLRHDILNVLNVIIHTEVNQPVSLHKVMNGYRLIDQPCNRIGVIRRPNNSGAVLLCHFLNGICHLRISADHEEGSIQFDCTKLRLIAISYQNNVSGFKKILQHFRAACRNQNLSLLDAAFFRTHNHLAIQRLQNILIACPGLGNKV